MSAYDPWSGEFSPERRLDGAGDELELTELALVGNRDLALVLTRLEVEHQESRIEGAAE